ncbi:protein of unknown function [Pararobbsia alpina]
MIQLNRPEQRIGLADMLCRVSEQRRDHACLVFCGDGCMTSLTVRQRDLPFLDDRVPNPREHEPFGKESGTDVNSRDTRPVQHALGDPMVARGVTLRVLACRDLRHIDDDREIRAARRIREIRGCLDESRANRIAQVCAVDTLRGADGVVMFEKIAHDHLGTQLAQRFRAFVFAVNEGANRVTRVKKILDRIDARLAGGCRDQILALFHFKLRLRLGALVLSAGIADTDDGESQPQRVMPYSNRAYAHVDLKKSHGMPNPRP